MPASAGRPGDDRPRGGTPGWLWALGGALIASAAWGGALFATGVVGGADGPELGYVFTEDLCDRADMTAFEDDYEPSPDGEPASRSFRSDDLDLGHCEFSLRPAGSPADEYELVYVSYDTTWHKGTDPSGEFAANAESYTQFNDDPNYSYYTYETEPIGDLGEEAYIVYGSDSASGVLSWVTLSVRDGWFEYAVTWNSLISGDGHAGLTSRESVTDTLIAATEATLAALREE
ncbi:hypothetical protein [Streptomyces sp. URMC 129]|uniref:hypothetical protein n=1 Tax=Streptomyces sp. URMC 129 TaxID=3423407 RepID=UPI003F1CC390